MGNRVANLIPRITALEDSFDSPPSGVPEQRRRGDLIRCATIPPVRLYSRRSFPPSKLNGIEEQLQPFSKNQESPRPVDHAQVGEDLFRLLEDLQEAILDYQVCLRPPRLTPFSTLTRTVDGAKNGY